MRMLIRSLLAASIALLPALPAAAQTSLGGGKSDDKSSPTQGLGAKPPTKDGGAKSPFKATPSDTPGRPSAVPPTGAQIPIRMYGGRYVGPYMTNPYQENNPYKANPFRDNNPFGKAP